MDFKSARIKKYQKLSYAPHAWTERLIKHMMIVKTHTH